MNPFADLENVYDEILISIRTLTAEVSTEDTSRALDAFTKSGAILQKVQQAEKQLERIVGRSDTVPAEPERVARLRAKLEGIRDEMKGLFDRARTIKDGLVLEAGHIRSGRKYVSAQTEVPKGTRLNSTI